MFFEYHNLPISESISTRFCVISTLAFRNTGYEVHSCLLGYTAV
jgi:hypothetical protein